MSQASETSIQPNNFFFPFQQQHENSSSGMDQAGVEQLVPGQERQYENFTSPGDHTLLLLLLVIPKEKKANKTLKAHECAH